MAVHQCPKCELRFGWKTEVDDHCWHDHPEFRHEYPAQAVREQIQAPRMSTTAGQTREPHRLGTGELFRWLRPTSPMSAPTPSRPLQP